MLSYGEMLDRMADALGARRRPKLPVPLVTPWLSSLWIGLVTPVDAAIALQAGLTNVRGTIAMARTGDPNSGTSEFFINTVDNRVLDPGGDAVHVGAVGEVRGQDLDRDAVLRAQPGGRLLEAVRVAGHQDECISPAGQGFGERGADAGRPPGHESGKHEI